MNHNKKRNSALLYEFLVRHISKCLVSGKKDEAKKALAISKRHFAAGTPLHEELCLFKSLLDTQVGSKHSAQRIIESVRKEAAKINVRTLDVAKSKAIKDINHTLKERSFYDYKIPGYVVYASAQTLLNDARNKKAALSEVQRITLEDVVCEHMTAPRKSVVTPLSKNENYNNTVYNLVVEKFHKKYEGKLTKDQKSLLTRYAACLISGDDRPLREHVDSESKRICETLRNVKDPALREDKDIMKKISECYNKFLSFEVKDIDDGTILEILRYMQLVGEILN